MTTRLRQLACLLFGAILLSKPVALFLRFLNRRFGIIQGLFIAYPADPSYARSYLPAKFAKRFRWKPWPVGFIRQGRPDMVESRRGEPGGRDSFEWERANGA